MRRSRFSFLRFSLLLTLVGLFLYSASVQEIHYLFINHHAELNEHCHNHLHAHTSHVECNLCKIELSSFLQASHYTGCTAQRSYTHPQTCNIQGVKLPERYSSVSPRGPPALA